MLWGYMEVSKLVLAVWALPVFYHFVATKLEIVDPVIFREHKILCLYIQRYENLRKFCSPRIALTCISFFFF